MVHVSPSEWFVWIISISLQCALIALLLRTGAWRRWRGLYFFVVVITVRHLIRICAITILKNPYVDFYAYWGGEILADITKIWLITEMTISLVGVHGSLRRRISHLVPALAAFLVTFSASVAFRGVSYHNLASWLCFMPPRLDMAIALAWLSTFLLISMLADAFSAWSNETSRIALGLSLELTSSCAIGWLNAHYPQHQHLFSGARSVAFIASLVIWMFSVHPPKPKTTTDYRQILSELRRQIDSFSEAIQNYEPGGAK